MLEAGEPASEPSLSVPYWDRWRHVSFYSSNLAIINTSLECIVSFNLSFPYSHCSSASYTPVFRRGPPFTLSTAHAADLEAVSQSTLDRCSGCSLHATEQAAFTAISGGTLKAIIPQERSLQPTLLASITRPCIRCESQIWIFCRCVALDACCIGEEGIIGAFRLAWHQCVMMV